MQRLKPVVIFIASTLIIACGAKNPWEEKQAPIRPLVTNPIPSMNNFNEWSPIWDGQSWIVAWKDSAGKNPSLASLKSRLLKGIISESPISITGENSFGISQSVKMEFIASPSKGSGESISGFSVVRFNPQSSTWNSVFPHISWSGFAQLNTTRATAGFFWNALNNTQDVAWAEPNLQSEITYAFPPEMATKSGIALPLLRIRADVALSNAVTASGKPAYEFGVSTAPDLNWTTVAVVDTGVDYFHPDLYSKVYDDSHIFMNPRETANCADDDGNGYIDDIYGIDSTMEREAWNTAVSSVCTTATPAQPIPGAADVGGPEKGCPSTGKKCGHGTHVAGIIAAKASSTNDKGGDTLGVCPSCRIVSIRVSDCMCGSKACQCSDTGVTDSGAIQDSSQIRAINYILQLTDASGSPYIRVVNMSLGKSFVSRSLSYWFRRLIENDILVVAAAGNDDTDTPSYPGAYDPVLAVCATSEEPSGNGGRGQYSKTKFSNFGAWVDICAPGYEIKSTVPGGGSSEKSGTSQATPFVAGAAGFLKSLYPLMSAAAIAERLTKYSDAYHLYYGSDYVNPMNKLYSGEYPGGTKYYLLGTGLLDLASAVTEGKACWNTADPTACTSFVYANKQLGYQSQVTGGCIISSIAGNKFSLSGILASMPFLMMQLWLIFKLWRTVATRAKKITLNT